MEGMTDLILTFADTHTKIIGVTIVAYKYI